MPSASPDQRPGEARADLSNWRSAPHSAWAFRNIPELMPVAAITGADPATAQPLPTAPASLDGLRLQLGNRPPLGLEDFLAATATDGLMVLKDGEVVFEHYDNGLEPRTPHILMSASKSVVGLVVGVLAGRGLLDLEAPVSALVPEVAATAWAGATLRQLIDMRAGVRFGPEDVAAYDLAANWSPVAPEAAPASLHAFLPGITAPRRPHGGPFAYVSANTDLMGWAIERATGRPFADLLSELIWKPMGAADDALITLDRAGAPRCTGGICATLGDLARLGDLVARDGRRGADQIIPAAWIDDISQGGDARAWKDGEFAQGFGGAPMRYRGGWYVIDSQPQVLFAMGIHGQNLFVDRASRMVVARLACQNAPIDVRAVALTHQAIPQIRRLLTGR